MLNSKRACLAIKFALYVGHEDIDAWKTEGNWSLSGVRNLMIRIGNPELETAMKFWVSDKRGTVVCSQPRRFRKRRSLVALCVFYASTVIAQTHAPNEFQLTRITKNLITAPEFSYGGAEQFRTGERRLWLEVEAEFVSMPEFTDELTFKYFILINGKLLTGEVTHINIPAGRENRSVMYVPPVVLARFNSNRPLAPNSVQNVAVQIVQSGAVRSELSLMRAASQWYKAISGIGGFVLNKNETPFAPLYWERYPQIKTATH